MKPSLFGTIAAIAAATVYFVVAATIQDTKLPGGLQLSGQTSRLAVVSQTLQFNGTNVPLTAGGGGGGALVGTLVTNGTGVSGDIVAFGASGTNAAKATSANVQGALGSVFQSTNIALTSLSSAGTNGFLGQIGGQTTNPALSSLSVAGTNGFLGQIGGIATNPPFISAGRFDSTSNSFRVLTNGFGLDFTRTNGSLQRVFDWETDDTIKLGTGTDLLNLFGPIGMFGMPTNRMMIARSVDNHPQLTNSVSRFPFIIALQPNVVPPTGTAAYIDVASADTKLVFSNTWTATYQYRIPGNFAGNLAVVLTCNEETQNTGTSAFTAEFWALAPGASASMGSQSFDSPNVAFSSVPGTARWPFDIQFACTNIDSMVAGSWFQMRLTCTTNTGLVNVESVQLGYDLQ